MDLLSGLMPGEEYDNPSHALHKSPQHLERLYIFALMWSVGALLELDDRAKMEAFLAQQGGLDLPPVAATETMFEYVVDEEGAWQHWSLHVQEYSYPTSAVPEYASILVPNVDNVRSTFLIHTVAKQNKTVLLIGEQGTAKTVTFKGHASRYDPKKHLFKAFNFSSASTPTLFQVGPWSHTLGHPPCDLVSGPHPFGRPTCDLVSVPQTAFPAYDIKGEGFYSVFYMQRWGRCSMGAGSQMTMTRHCSTPTPRCCHTHSLIHTHIYCPWASGSLSCWSSTGSSPSGSSVHGRACSG